MADGPRGGGKGPRGGEGRGPRGTGKGRGPAGGRGGRPGPQPGRSRPDDRAASLPPRPARRSVAKPRLGSEGPPPRLPAPVYRELRSAVRGEQFDDAVRAFAEATDALEADEAPRAVELLEWVKDLAGRSGAVREALGIARYHAGDFEGAHRELLAFRRITESADQNHLLADCARALGRHEKVVEYVDEMRARRVPRERLVEAMIVLAGDRADRGDLRGALATLEELDLDPAALEPWYARAWYAAGDLAERMGDRERARDYFEAVLAVDDEFLDAAERLAALD